MHKTYNNSPDKAITIKIMQQVLSDLSSLTLLTKQAHWNIRGRTFIAIHKMLDTFYEELTEYTDLVAEHIVQAGGQPEGTVEAIYNTTKVKAYPTQGNKVRFHLKNLIERYAFVADEIQDFMPSMKDLDAQDKLIEISRDLDKWLWFLEAHIIDI